jgi:hypothetical protein
VIGFILPDIVGVFRTRWLMLLLLATAGCAARAPLFYEKPMHSPRVRGTMGGQPVRMVIDTGAQVSAVSHPVAARVGVALSELRSPGVDPAGRPVKLWRIAAPGFAVEGLGRLDERPAAAIVFPAVLAPLGLEVVLSPQGLVAGSARALVVDLPRGQLLHTTWARALDRYGSRGRVLSPEQPVCRHGDAELRAGTLVVQGVVAGQPTSLEVDTGSAGLVLLASSPAGQALAARGGGAAVQVGGAGGRSPAVAYSQVPVRIGEIGGAIPAVVTPGRRRQVCGWDGRIGMDILRHCTIAVGDGRFFIRCFW